MDTIMEQPPMVLGVGALAVVVLIAILVNSLSAPAKQKDVKQLSTAEDMPTGTKAASKKKKKPKKQNEAEPPAAKEKGAPPAKEKELILPKKEAAPPTKVEKAKPVESKPAPAPEPTPDAAGKKKKKKKGAVHKAPEPESEPEPEATPEPEPEPEPEQAPEPAAESDAAKKKKKKKNKKKKTGSEDEPTKQPEAKVVTDEDDEEESDDDDVALLLKNRKQTKPQVATNGQQAKIKKEAPKPKKPEEPPAPVVVDPNAVHTIILNIEASDKPILVGPKGATIQGIQFESNARLDIDGSVVKITGTEAAIAVAMEQVKKVLDDYKEEQRRLTASSITLSGKQINGSDGVKAIIGKGGSTIQSIQTETGCKLDANVEKGMVVITGPTEEQVTRAATLCKHAVFGESQHVIELGNVGTVMVVYGKDFAKIRQMQTDSGAKLDIAKGSTKLEISGPTEAVVTARRMVEEWVEYCKGEVIMIEASKVGAVYGKGGATVRRIQERTGAIIQVDDQGKKGKEMVPCQILGEPEMVEQAKALVLGALDGDVELKPGEIMEKMDLDVGAPAVIGRGGTRIRELETKFGIKLLVNGNMGTIAGKKEAVMKAKAEIEKIIAPLIEEKRIAAEAERLAAEAQSSADPGPWGGKFDDGAEGW